VADVANVVNNHLQDMKVRHDLTQEWMMLGALKGIILDGDGDVMYDLYKEFGIQKKVIEFKLSDPAFNVKKPAWMYAVTLKRTCWVMSPPVSGLGRCRLHGCTDHPPECGKGIPGLGRCPGEYRR
jgi:hypothetical protein